MGGKRVGYFDHVWGINVMKLSYAIYTAVITVLLAGCQTGTQVKPKDNAETATNQPEAVNQVQDIWSYDRTHIVKWTLWSYDSEIDLTTISKLEEQSIQDAFNSFKDGEYRQWKNESLGTMGFTAGSKYQNSEGLNCRNYSITVETIGDTGQVQQLQRPAIACFNEGAWEFDRSIL